MNILYIKHFLGFRFNTIINFNNIKYPEKTEKMMKYYLLMSNELKNMHVEKTLKLFDVYNVSKNNHCSLINIGNYNFYE